MIEKPTVIITSGGRTGTTFFKKLFEKCFENVASVQEPENIHISTIKEKMKDSGNRKIIFQKIIGKWGITSISNKVMGGKISKNQAANEITKQRKKYIEIFKEDLYVESSYHYYGLLDVLPLVFKNYKAIYIIRDPRNWVTSHLNKKEFYHLSNANTWLRTRISPRNVNDKKYIKLWKKMDRFEKLCWAWNYINNYAQKSIEKNRTIKLYRFEDIFNPNKENLFELINYLIDFEKINIEKPKNLKEIIIKMSNTKIHQTHSYQFPKWTKWSKDEAKKLNDICGEVMEKFGYGKEYEWKQKIQNT